MPIVTEKLTPPTLRNRVAAKIRDAIRRGSFRPGERIIERELAAQFGTSLTVVREAIVQLEAEGLITKRANASTAVVELTTRDILDIFAVRRELERHAVIEAARLITDDECRELEQLHRRALKAAASGDVDDYLEADLAWHQAIWRDARNKFLGSALQRVVVQLFGFALVQVAHVPGFDLVGDAKAHGELMTAIIRRNPVEAEKAFATAIEVWLDYALSAEDTPVAREIRVQ